MSSGTFQDEIFLSVVGLHCIIIAIIDNICYDASFKYSLKCNFRL